MEGTVLRKYSIATSDELRNNATLSQLARVLHVGRVHAVMI